MSPFWCSVVTTRFQENRWKPYTTLESDYRTNESSDAAQTISNKKCQAHKKDNLNITKGNKVADEAATLAKGSTKEAIMAPQVTVTIQPHITVHYSTSHTRVEHRQMNCGCGKREEQCLMNMGCGGHMKDIFQFLSHWSQYWS